MKPERLLVAQILEKWGATSGLHLRRNNSGALYDHNGRLIRFGLPGSADIEGIVAPRGRFIAIECKTLTGHQRKLQKNYQRMVESNGGIYIIARSLTQFDVALHHVFVEERLPR